MYTYIHRHTHIRTHTIEREKETERMRHKRDKERERERKKKWREIIQRHDEHIYIHIHICIPYVGLYPTIPQYAAGRRTDPPVSEPIALGER